jgi:hypothetical protein
MRPILIILLTALLITATACKKNGVINKLEEIKIAVHDKAYPLRLIKEPLTVKIVSVYHERPVIAKVNLEDSLTIVLNQEKKMEIWKYDLNFKLQEKFRIHRGEGPNEVLYPCYIGGNEKVHFILDPPARKIYMYDAGFKVRQALTGNRPGYAYDTNPMYFLAEKNLLVLMYYTSPSRSVELHSIYTRKIVGHSLQDKKIYDIEKVDIDNERFHVRGEPYHYIAAGDYIYILEGDKYRLIKKDLGGKTVKQVVVTNFEKKSFSRAQRERWVKEWAWRGMSPQDDTFPEKLHPACWLLRLKDGIAVAVRSDYGPHKSEYIRCDYFDKNLNFLGKINIPYFWGWNHVNLGHINVDALFFFHKERLYFLQLKEMETDEDYYLTKWRVEEGKI